METLQFVLQELEAVDKKIEKTERALHYLEKQKKEAGCKLADLTKKREVLSNQYKELIKE